ncbi:DUF1775 domain-containing protein [Microvirga puerhi]|uniref:DUF1775 domain-containing protein n=1 Tax=Microvirga puerhi TaxID=2876078 RepID=A0ABS7VJY6_9HYPH|nr:DUF1775 domain-containing protein [Microvirga puerhi]MBZ6075534.1 DUF1775 domain-containing protein [Microvirga puerhi]
MKLSLSGGALAASVLALSATSALAHVSFETAQTAPNSTYKAVLRVPHGCGGQPTLKIRVRIPEGIIAVKPMPKPGWTLETVKGAYARSYSLYGDPVGDGVKEIVWTGSLDDAFYDEFVFQARFTDAFQPGATVYFPVVQTCSNGSEQWTQVPTAGQDPNSLKSPAPAVRIAAAGMANAVAPVIKAGDLTIEQPWSRATPGGAKVGGGYLRVTNTGKEPDRLIGGSFPLADRVELHEMSMADNIMRMKPVEGGLVIAPGATVELKPGGYHLMFMDLKEPLKDGQSVKGTLVFEKAGTVDVTYVVRGMNGAMGGQDAAPMEHKH